MKVSSGRPLVDLPSCTVYAHSVPFESKEEQAIYDQAMEIFQEKINELIEQEAIVGPIFDKY